MKSAERAFNSTATIVNIDKIARQLRREATANPKKAAFLGVAALVALYFWMPLIWGWIGKSEKDTSDIVAPSGARPVASAAMPSVASDAKAAAKVVGAGRLPWSLVAQQMHDDPRMKTSATLTMTRDPFEPPKTEVAESTAAEESKLKPKPPLITPSAAGLVLTSTIIGSQRRIAQICGRSYVVGQSIEAVKAGETLGAAFKLVDVQPRRAILEADGQRFELTIPEPDKSSRIEFLGAAAKP